jgi:hypothetical protein
VNYQTATNQTPQNSFFHNFITSRLVLSLPPSFPTSLYSKFFRRTESSASLPQGSFFRIPSSIPLHRFCLIFPELKNNITKTIHEATKHRRKLHSSITVLDSASTPCKLLHNSTKASPPVPNVRSIPQETLANSMR